MTSILWVSQKEGAGQKLRGQVRSCDPCPLQDAPICLLSTGRAVSVLEQILTLSQPPPPTRLALLAALTTNTLSDKVGRKTFQSSKQCQDRNPMCPAHVSSRHLLEDTPIPMGMQRTTQGRSGTRHKPWSGQSGIRWSRLYVTPLA